MCNNYRRWKAQKFAERSPTKFSKIVPKFCERQRRLRNSKAKNKNTAAKRK